jgi:SAM-dependent methyltransferase
MSRSIAASGVLTSCPLLVLVYRMELGVTRNYVRIAGQYDFWTDLVFHRLLDLYQWRGRTIEQLGEVRGSMVLDVGCGTGNNWPLLLPRVGSSGHVIGVDYSTGMLEQARRQADRAGWSNVSLIEDDAAKIAHLDGSVDVSLVSLRAGGGWNRFTEDMDNARLKARWETGKAVLSTLLPDLVEERFFHNAGMILHGTRPARSDSSASKAPR